ncbi:MAG TPA: glycosyltransferase family 4 protein [Actinoplanes sp.]|nr:glycosyltransferase family 4 protein [Actinoplanes sp.]
MSTYLALGRRRLRAAATYAATLPPPVTLVTTADLPAPPGVTVRRVETPRAARAFLAPGVFTGDCEALALAYRAGVATRLEPAPDPGRRTAPADLAVVTPWYPSPDDPFAGAFVAASAAAAGPYLGRVSILHTQSWYYEPGRLAGQLTGVAAERQAARCGPAVVLDTPEGELTRVAAPSPAGGDHLAYADAQTAALRASLPTGRIEAPVVHAHTGIMGGVVAARLARPDARIVVTEHATFLDQVFARPGAKQRYERMLARAGLLLCVGRALRDQLAREFPAHAGKLRIVPNAVDFDRFAVRPPPAEPLRWLYLGRLMAHKGVLTLVEAFARVSATDPRLTLTLVGSGPAQDEVARRIAELGLDDRITVRPPVPPEEVTGLLHRHDLLVHASRRETFGMTVVEAIATGTPVLVARSEGPAETLDGIGDLAGQVFEPTEDPDVIAEAYHKLRARFGELDLAGARDALLARYGREAVGARLHEAYTEEGAPAPVTVPEPPVPAAQRFAARFASPLPEALVRAAQRAVRHYLRIPA